MIQLEIAVHDRVDALCKAARALRHERSATVVDGRLSRRMRLRLRLGRQLVVIGTRLMQGPAQQRGAIASR